MDNGLIYGQHHYVDASQPAVTSLPASGVLFNLLDEQKVGVVPLIEIERRWNDDAVPNLPGVLEALRDLSPANQMISFEVFDWSLRVAYSRAQRRKNEEKISKIEHRRRDLYGGGHSGCTRPHAPQSYPRTVDGYRSKQQAKDAFYNKREQPNNNNNKPQSTRPPPPQQQQDNNNKQPKPTTTTMTDGERAMNLARLKQENDRLLQRLTATSSDRNEEARSKSSEQQQKQQQQPPITSTKSRRRRTRSGPAITSKIIASLKRNTQKSADKKEAEEGEKNLPLQQPPPQQQQQQKCSSSGSSSGRGSITPPLSANEHPPHDSNNVQTPNRLFVDLGTPTAKPISLKGKTYIGVTGIRQQQQHQQNKHPKTSTPNNHPSVTNQQHVTLGRRRETPCGGSATDNESREESHRKILAKMKSHLESRSPYFLVASQSMGRPKSVDPDTKQPLGGCGGGGAGGGLDAVPSPFASPRKSDGEGSAWKEHGKSSGGAAAGTSKSKRRNPRRYTLSNDIDVAQLTRVRKLQQESEVLHETMQELAEVVDRLKRRHTQVSAHVRQHADGEKRTAGKMEHTSDDRMQLLANTASDLTEISRDLLYPNATDLKCKIVQQSHKEVALRESNKRLKELLHDKCGRIKVLEEEKMLLIQQLFQLKSVASPNSSSIFI